MKHGFAYYAGCALRTALALAPDGAAMAGAGLCAYGAALIYHPAGYIVGGVLMIGFALLTAWAENGS